MTFPFLKDDRDASAELPVTLLGNPGLAREPWVQVSADVEQGYACLRQGIQIIEGLRLRHAAAQDRIFAIEATDLVRVGDGPGVGFPGRQASAFQHWFG